MIWSPKETCNPASKPVGFYLENGVLMCNWSPSVDVVEMSVHQIVISSAFRYQILHLAHDNLWSGHLGIGKTYTHGLKHFFWPPLKCDVTKYCRSFHICQRAGNPNQTIPPAPLHPIPAIGEPFTHMLLDCIGPVPKTKTGNIRVFNTNVYSNMFP